MSSTTLPVVRPSVEFLDDILLSVEKGVLRIPRFQRPFQWRPPQMTALLDSVLSGYPIGSLLLWESTGPVESLDRIGPVAVPCPSTGRLTYVLDGHQRVSTLYGALRLPADVTLTGPEEWIWNIWYDLQERQFVHVRSASRPPHFLAVRSLSRTLDFLRECRRIAAECPSDAERLIQEAESVATRIRAYKIPINVISGEIEQAVETFSRLNTTGRQMSVDQMVSALTYREGPAGFHLDSRIDDILDKLTVCHYGNVSRKIIFRTIVASMGMDVYRTNWSRLSEKISPTLPERVDKTEESLVRAALMLSLEVGVPCDAVLPYEPQLMLFAHWLTSGGGSDQQLSQMIRWFWRSSFSSWFAGTSDSQMNSYLDAMKLFAEGGDESLLQPPPSVDAEPLPSNFNMRNARVRTFVLFLKSLSPRSLVTGETISIDEVLQSEGARAMVYVVPGRRSAAGNRILLGSAEGTNLCERLLRMGDDIRNDVLASHGIPRIAFMALRDGNVDIFIAQRNAHLAKLEREFMATRGVKESSSKQMELFGRIDDAAE